ncbi:RiPP maturation radical SAM C-methyltransferase [Nonomuraea sp. NPDC050536]|uniref:RiPP maturation radical SAM C-methyltransferase n=1 Tax=Nonomuraea sp. NPDC050536 TaxID=3364366 RepID=UPI0037CC1D95
MRVALVNMPWAAVDFPSIALGILVGCVRESRPDDELYANYANLGFVDWLADRVPLNSADYKFYSLESYFLGCGDWVFSSALYGNSEWRLEEFEKTMRGNIPERYLKVSRLLHEQSPEFVQEVAASVVAWEPDVVGFTTTFQQNTASLATAKQIKKLAPDTITVFGGANCDGPQGAAIQRNFPFVDFVVRGEGETAFPRLLDALDGDGDVSGIPGLCWRDRRGAAQENAVEKTPVAPAAMVTPSYDEYFEHRSGSLARTWAEPALLVEGARGCWWGEKHHCTFCGLNGSLMQFRSKHPDTFLKEVIDLVERHQTLDVYVVDNILDMRYINSMLPKLAESGYDLRFHYEIKSNLKRDQLRVLADAGVLAVQPGIESLNSRTLRIMDKGVTGCQNVRLLRDAVTTGISVEWNYLYGFPEELPEDYESVIEQLPALHHLAPPDSMARIAIERFSPYFERPELGFSALKPAAQYRLVYDLPESELLDFCYVFESEQLGIGEELAGRLEAALDEWRRQADRSRLTHCDLGDRIVVVSDREQFGWDVLSIEDPMELAAFRLLDDPRSAESLARRLSESLGSDVARDSAEALLHRWKLMGLVFHDQGQYVQVAVEAVNQELLRSGAVVRVGRI